jgi:5-methylthioadenosine/S-adenosylhomocysteine deaminase
VADVLSADWVLPISAPPIENGAVVFENGRIVAVGPASELGEGTRYADAVILPGFVNAHSHLEYAVYAGFGDGLEFGPWLDTHVRRKRRIGWEEFLDIARLGVAECLRSGITTTADTSFSGAAAVACGELGLRAIVHLETFGATVEAAMDWYEELRARVGDAFSDLVRPGISPHAPYTVSIDAYAACARIGMPVATHLNESRGELEWLRSGTGPMAPNAEILVPPPGTSGIRLLAAHELLGPNVLAVHCVVVDAEEIELLARYDVAVAHCPRSNAFLGCGIAPVDELLAAGIRVGLGTDSPASTPSFDMFDEMRAAVALARLRLRRPEAMPAAHALELATLGSARALGLDRELGSLEPGKRADLAIVSLERSPFLPWEDAAAAVVLGGSPDRVVSTLVEGQVRYVRGKVEWPELQQRGRSARRRLLGSGQSAAVGTRRSP